MNLIIGSFLVSSARCMMGNYSPFASYNPLPQQGLNLPFCFEVIPYPNNQNAYFLQSYNPQPYNSPVSYYSQKPSNPYPIYSPPAGQNNFSPYNPIDCKQVASYVYQYLNNVAATKTPHNAQQLPKFYPNAQYPLPHSSKYSYSQASSSPNSFSASSYSSQQQQYRRRSSAGKQYPVPSNVDLSSQNTLRSLPQNQIPRRNYGDMTASPATSGLPPLPKIRVRGYESASSIGRSDQRSRVQKYGQNFSYHPINQQPSRDEANVNYQNKMLNHPSQARNAHSRNSRSHSRVSNGQISSSSRSTSTYVSTPQHVIQKPTIVIQPPSSSITPTDSRRSSMNTLTQFSKRTSS